MTILFLALWLQMSAQVQINAKDFKMSDCNKPGMTCTIADGWKSPAPPAVPSIGHIECWNDDATDHFSCMSPKGSILDVESALNKLDENTWSNEGNGGGDIPTHFLIDTIQTTDPPSKAVLSWTSAEKPGAADETDGKPLKLKSPSTPETVATFHHCAIDGGTGNADGYQTMSEIYKCDEGRIELKGKWTKFIEYSTIFDQEMGRPSGIPERISIDEEKKHFRWCPVKNSPVPELELCGLWPENGEVLPVDECTPGKRGGEYTEDCVCRKDGKSLFCKER